MKLRVELSEAEIKTAIVRYLEGQGFSGVSEVTLSRDGYTDSLDQRENVLTYSATAKGEPPKRK